MIENFSEVWSAARAMDAVLAGVANTPPIDDKYFAILYGAIDSLGQSIGADSQTSMKALLHYFKRYSDGAEIAHKVLSSPRDQALVPWVVEAGRAVHAMRVGYKDPMQALLPLAERYRISTS